MTSHQLKPSENQSGCDLFATTKTTHNTRWGQDVTVITTQQRVCCCRMLKDSLGPDMWNVGNMSDTYLASATRICRAHLPRTSATHICHAWRGWMGTTKNVKINLWHVIQINEHTEKKQQFNQTILERGLMFLCSIRCRKYLWKTLVWI